MKMFIAFIHTANRKVEIPKEPLQLYLCIIILYNMSMNTILFNCIYNIL